MTGEESKKVKNGSAVDIVLPEIPPGLGSWAPLDVSDDDSLIPHALFSRFDRLGRVADWTMASADGGGLGDQYRRGDDRRKRMHFPSQQVFGVGTESAFTFEDAKMDDNTFNVVDRSVSQRRFNFKQTRYIRRGGMGGRGRQATGFGRGQHIANLNQQGRKDERRQGGVHRRQGAWSEKSNKAKDFSVEIKPYWTELNEYPFSGLLKLYFKVSPPVDIAFRGTLHMYEKAYESIVPKSSEFVLVDSDIPPTPSPTVRDDPYFKEIMDKYPDEFMVFTTDTVLSTLMCSTRSVYPWDIIIEKKGNKLILDKHPNGSIDTIHVNECFSDVPLAEGGGVNTLNSVAFLAEEAKRCNWLLPSKVQDRNYTIRFPESVYYKQTVVSETEQGEVVQEKIVKAHSGFAFRYRKWSLEDGVSLIVRMKVDMVLPKDNRSVPKNIMVNSVDDLSDFSLMNIKALTECDPKSNPATASTPDWRTTLDNNCGTVFANELKNNNNKIFKWVVEAILAGVDCLKFGFVSRIRPSSRDRHLCILLSHFITEDLSQQINLDMGKCWGIVKTFVDYIRDDTKIPSGEYALLKDPNKPALKLFSCCKNNVENEELDIKVAID